MIIARHRRPEGLLSRLMSERRGAAYVEFLIAFIPLFIMFLGMVQMCLMYAGDLVVQHAATTAARAAVVVIDDDPAKYDGAPRDRIDRYGSSDTGRGIDGLLVLFGGGRGGSVPGSGGPRYSAIRQAASIPLLAISPSMSQLMNADSVRTAIGNPEERALTGATIYNNSAMGVTFPVSPGANSYRSAFNRDDQVTARVTYLFHCAVPLANKLMCETYPTIRLGPAAAAIEGIVRDLGDGTLTYDSAMERIGRIDESRRRHERDNPAIDELSSAGSDSLMYLTWGTGSRFKILRAEATMPLQYARYEYH